MLKGAGSPCIKPTHDGLDNLFSIFNFYKNDFIFFRNFGIDYINTNFL